MPLARSIWARSFVAALVVRGVGADKERVAVLGDPRREFVQVPVERVEQHHAGHPLAEPADLQAPRGGLKAAAVGDDDDRHVREGFHATRVSIGAGELVGGFRHEPLQPITFPELAGARFAAS